MVHRRPPRFAALIPLFSLVLLGACSGGAGLVRGSGYTVTSGTDGGGVIVPARAGVGRSAAASFTVLPQRGYLIAGVSGCGGRLHGNIYITGAVTADCRVSARFALAAGWRWMGGSSTVNARGVYGQAGATATAIPGARDSAAAWRDGGGDLWLFGGEGIDSAGKLGELNDLWRYRPAGNRWRWTGGSGSANAPGVYGARGIAAAGNVPGARDSAAAWRDAKGNFWLFGGESLNPAGNPVELDDLWRYDPVAAKWGWMGGSRLLDAKGVYGAPRAVPGARDSAAIWTDARGRLWLFGGWGYDSAGNSGELNDLWRYDPAAGMWRWMGGADTTGARGSYGRQGRSAAANMPGARDGAVTWNDAHGHVWLFGGWGYDADWNVGYLNDLWRYDLTTGRWTWLGGADAVNARGVHGRLGAAAPANVPGARAGAVTWRGANGDLWLFGGEGSDAAGKRGRYNDLWRYDPAGNEWSWMGGARSMDAKGVYGRGGAKAALDFPGARGNAASWLDNSGDLWLFGGVAFGSGGDAKDVLNDLWLLRQ